MNITDTLDAMTGSDLAPVERTAENLISYLGKETLGFMRGITLPLLRTLNTDVTAQGWELIEAAALTGTKREVIRKLGELASACDSSYYRRMAIENLIEAKGVDYETARQAHIQAGGNYAAALSLLN